ncbi:MAG: monovalent cation/H+ antiporter complex subunit F [Azonexus sp.]|nr:monovalent cation/H+ antiporter complex subunit F [Azonexus sp.]
MNGFDLAIALFLLGNLIVALLVAARGPTSADRMLMALLFGSTGTGILVLLAQAMHIPALVDVALVLALLAAIGGVAFAKRAWQGDGHD